MFAGRTARTLFFSSSCLISGLAGTTAAGGYGLPASPRAELALQQLQSDFHGAGTTGDYELMKSLWAHDAVFHGPAGPVVGPEAIANFFSSGPRWGVTASLAPTYKTWFDIRGNTAVGQFECILVETPGLDPLDTPLSSIPFGSQNPNVEIVQHSTASVTAVRQRGRWVIQTFTGGAGPM